MTNVEEVFQKFVRRGPWVRCTETEICYRHVLTSTLDQRAFATLSPNTPKSSSFATIVGRSSSSSLGRPFIISRHRYWTTKPAIVNYTRAAQ